MRSSMTTVLLKLMFCERMCSSRSAGSTWLYSIACTRSTLKSWAKKHGETCATRGKTTNGRQIVQTAPSFRKRCSQALRPGMSCRGVAGQGQQAKKRGRRERRERREKTAAARCASVVTALRRRSPSLLAVLPFSFLPLSLDAHAGALRRHSPCGPIWES